jgi:tRNA-dihydrouridine synthase
MAWSSAAAASAAPGSFAELAAVFDGREPADPPRLDQVLAILREHGTLLVDFFGERKGVLELRKWCAWYTKGFDGSARVREALQRIESLAEMDLWLAQLDGDQDFPKGALRVAAPSAAAARTRSRCRPAGSPRSAPRKPAREGAPG